MGEGSAALAEMASTGIGTRVIHDANGVVGLQFTSPVQEASSQGSPSRATEPGNVGAVERRQEAGVIRETAYGSVAGDALAGARQEATLENRGAKAPALKSTASSRGAFVASFVRDWNFSGKDDPVQDMVFAGTHWAANPKFTNGDLVQTRYGDSEIVQEVVGLSILGADIGFNAARAVFGPNVQNMGPQARLDALGAMAGKGAHSAIQGAIDTGFNLGDAVREAAAQNKLHEERYNAAKDAFNEAWDYREKLQEQEAVRQQGGNIGGFF
ncbi:hypothetical protein [Tortoise microvirus 75]|nr:hypothetical protein [Tortoise microvirus 75]